jgi:glutathione S-transferase
MLTLFHAPRSRSSRFIWLLEELGATYGIEYMDIPRQDGTGASDPRNPHPDRKVPALVHDGVLVTESAAIALYLTDLFPRAAMGPAVGDPARGPYLTWLAYYAGVMEPVSVTKFSGVADAPWAVRSWGGVAAMERRLLDAMRAGDYVLGDRFSAVDVLVTSMGLFARELLPADAIVDRYLDRTKARPALARAFARDAPT